MISTMRARSTTSALCATTPINGSTFRGEALPAGAPGACRRLHVIWPDHLEEGGRWNLYRVVLQELVEEASQEEEIVGMLLTGSVARGDALPGSDLDVRYLLPEGRSRLFQSEPHYGIVVERSYTDLPGAQSKLEVNPMEVY